MTLIRVNPRQSRSRPRVAGALNLDPLNYDPEHLPPERESSVLLYRSNLMCRKAFNAARRTKKMGYGKVMPAGIGGWIAAKLPTQGEEQSLR
jgi:rhodanese-related sulfurtransferase